MYPLRAMPHDREPTSVMMDNGVVQNSAIARPNDEGQWLQKMKENIFFYFIFSSFSPSEL